MSKKQLTLTIIISILSLCIIFVGALKFEALAEPLQRRPSPVHDADTISTVPSSAESPGCPSNRTEASERGRQCSRKCKLETGCDNLRKSCLCDGICGWSCIRPDSTCIDLPKISNGNYYPRINKFNTRVRYECDTNYYLFGPRERICQGDEEWSEIAPECMSEPACLSPPKVAHARNPNDGYFRLREKVVYSCYPGYDSHGSHESVCSFVGPNHTGWMWPGPEFKCIPKSCGDPGHIANGRRQGDSFIIASAVMFTCNEGYEMIGQSSRYCQSDGQWSGQQPHCEPIVCAPTDHLENGRMNYEDPLVFNSSVEYTCDYGFRLVGPKYRLCGIDKQLIGEMPRCEEIDCGHPGALRNGFVRGYNSKIGDKIHFTCLEGMTFEGPSNVSTCTESGSWSHTMPRCLAPCQVPNVERSQSLWLMAINISNSTNSTMSNFQNITSMKEIKPQQQSDDVTTKDMVPVRTGMYVNYGRQLYVKCELDHELDEQLDHESHIIGPPTCNANGTWTHWPRCVPIKCRSLPIAPENGMILLMHSAHGSRARVRCVDGFRLDGDQFVLCEKGQWSTINAKCNEIYCTYPGAIEHGRVLLIGHMGMYDYRSYIRKVSHNRQLAYECETGYHANEGAPSGATCTDGQWAPRQLPQCIKDEPRVKITNQTVSVTTR